MIAARPPRVRHALVLAPHPDDETIGAFALIRALRRRGTIVRVLVATDGAASHPRSRRWPAPRLAAERRREVRGALRRAGVAADGVRFLGMADGTLSTQPGAARRRLAGAILCAARPGLIVQPVAEDDHPDHRAVAAAARAARGPGLRRYGYLVWPGGARRPPRVRLGLTLGPARAVKRAAILAHRTQCGLIDDDPAGFAISRRQLARFAAPRECFVAVPR